MLLLVLKTVKLKSRGWCWAVGWLGKEAGAASLFTTLASALATATTVLKDYHMCSSSMYRLLSHYYRVSHVKADLFESNVLFLYPIVLGDYS